MSNKAPGMRELVDQAVVTAQDVEIWQLQALGGRPLTWQNHVAPRDEPPLTRWSWRPP